MSNPLELAIFALKRELGKAAIDDPCPICSYEAAIRLLETAGRVDKEKALTAMTWIPAKTPGFMELHALCSALPDEQVKRGCPNPEDYPKISDIEQLAALPDELADSQEKEPR